MKKLILTAAAILCLTGAAMAQDETQIRVPQGYQGFLDQNSLYRVFDDMNTTVGFSTTHGFYFGGHTFIGVGFGVEGGDDFFAMPLYTAVKYNFTYSRQVSPTVQARVGSYISDHTGAYADVAIGLRFASKRDFAVNVMLAGSFYEPVKDSYSTYDAELQNYRTVTNKINPSGIGLRVGIEW